eukprot:m.236011 g.236011  ORF g.236011 m.236011 type:complete len:239 (+) comp13918_c1_seq4:3358-4074(+)
MPSTSAHKFLADEDYEYLGRGATSTVFKGKIEIDEKEEDVAMKVFREKEDYDKEKSIMDKVVPLLEDDTPVLKLIKRYDEELILCYQPVCTRLNVVTKPIVSDIVTQVDALHCKGYCHCDLRPPNLCSFVKDGYQRGVVIDFGFSVKIGEGSRLHHMREWSPIHDWAKLGWAFGYILGKEGFHNNMDDTSYTMFALLLRLDAFDHNTLFAAPSQGEEDRKMRIEALIGFYEQMFFNDE